MKFGITIWENFSTRQILGFFEKMENPSIFRRKTPQSSVIFSVITKVIFYKNEKIFINFLKIKRFLKITESKAFLEILSLKIFFKKFLRKNSKNYRRRRRRLPQPSPEFGGEAALKFLKFLRN